MMKIKGRVPNSDYTMLFNLLVTKDDVLSGDETRLGKVKVHAFVEREVVDRNEEQIEDSLITQSNDK